MRPAVFNRRHRNRPADDTTSSSGVSGGGPPETDLEAAKRRARDLFDRGQQESRLHRYAQAEEYFAAADAVTEGFGELMNWRVMFRLRRAVSLRGSGRSEEALAILEKLTADQEKLTAAGLGHVFNREHFPDELPSIYWNRALCLKDLGRLTEARAAIPALIEEIGTGATPQQREYLGHAYLLAGKVAQSEGDHDQALKAVEMALAHASRYDEPWAKDLRRGATWFKRALLAEARLRRTS